MSKNMVARAAALLAVPALILGISSPASATDQSVTLKVDGHTVASLKFIDDGDDFELWDRYADGHGVRAFIEVNNGTWQEWGSFYNGKGADTYVRKTDGNLYSWNKYRAQVCTVDGAGDTSPVRCSAWMSISE
ncbi:hypothetical protein [Kitasatospora fiedleri]|uniref:hypothetical protein n=1 Tax=Kitasatospora fiedleri TaxID=2991545 RepID=UPI000CBE9115|nr:hypothetical protein [Kitasatospora fiedleri]